MPSINNHQESTEAVLEELLLFHRRHMTGEENFCLSFFFFKRNSALF